MKKKPQFPREAALTLAATVAVLGTSIGVAPQDILAADSAPAKNAAQGKEPRSELTKSKPGAASVKMSKHAPGAVQDKWKPGATQYKDQKGADQFKFKPGAVQDKH
jgi:hypothetical protein